MCDKNKGPVAHRSLVAIEGVGLCSPAIFNSTMAPLVHVYSGQLTLGMLSKPKEKARVAPAAGIPRSEAWTDAPAGQWKG